MKQCYYQRWVILISTYDWDDVFLLLVNTVVLLEGRTQHRGLRRRSQPKCDATRTFTVIDSHDYQLRVTCVSLAQNSTVKWSLFWTIHVVGGPLKGLGSVAEQHLTNYLLLLSELLSKPSYGVCV